MCSLRESLRVAALATVLVSAAPMARGEVAAEIDAFGKYVRTVVVSNASARNLRIWAPVRTRVQRVMLNPSGDSMGDLWPTIVESPADRLPWVVWSRFQGTDYELVWSRWTEVGWLPVTGVLDDAAPGADLDPWVTFDVRGRPYVAWWRDENGVGRVYITLFCSTRWMTALPVSDLEMDSRSPSLEVLPDGRMRVVYDTPEGTQSKIVALLSGATITDDINPFKSLTVTADVNPPALSR